MGIIVADDVFGSAPGGEDANEELLLTASDLAAARHALEGAVARFRSVDGLGVEHEEDDELWHGQKGLRGHSCKYDSGVTEVDGALHVALDCQGVIPPAMGQAYVRILRDELERAGVDDAIVRVPPRQDEDGDLVRTRETAAVAPEEPVPSWVVRFEGTAELPLGFPADLELPAGASVVYAEAQVWHSSTLLTYHDGSWGAQLVLAVDDRDGALAHFEATLPRQGYAAGERATQQREEGEAVAIGFHGKGLEIEVNAIGPDVAKQIDPAFRAMPGKAAVLVVAFQRHPNAKAE